MLISKSTSSIKNVSSYCSVLSFGHVADLVKSRVAIRPVMDVFKDKPRQTTRPESNMLHQK
jgi:hypothetical protein